MKEKLRYISNNIKSYRARMGYTQEQMASILDITRNTYCDYEVNVQKVKVETLQEVADILHCNLSDFFVRFNVTKRDKITTKENEN